MKQLSASLSSLTSLVAGYPKAHPKLLPLLDRAVAEEHKVVFTGWDWKALYFAHGDHHGIAFVEELLRNGEFRQRLSRLTSLNLEEVRKLAPKGTRYPLQQLDRALTAAYSQIDQVFHPDPRLVAVIGREEALVHECLVVGVTDGVVHTAATGPRGEQYLKLKFESSLDFRRRIAQAAGLSLTESTRLRIASRAQRIDRTTLTETIDRYLPRTVETEFTPEERRDLTRNINREYLVQGVEVRKSRRLVKESQLEKLFNSILRKAYLARASDVRIAFDFERRELLTEFCVDGRWFPVAPFALAREGLFQGLVGIIKRRAGITAPGNRAPQDGTILFRTEIDGEKTQFEARTTMIPATDTRFRDEDNVVFVFRLHRDLGELRDIHGLGGFAAQTELLKTIAETKNGLVIITGVTNSGKGGTTKAMMMHAKKVFPWKSVYSLEDPVESRVPGIVQVELNPTAGLTAQAFLSRALRSNPQILNIAEIRDPETARFAIDAANTGILVFSTLHARNPFLAINRFQGLGVDRMDFAAAVTAVITQELFPLVCRACGTPDPDPEWHRGCPGLDTMMLYLRDKFSGPMRERLETFRPRKANPAGCPACRSGYAGRIAAFEIWLPGLHQAMVAAGTDIATIREQALLRGHQTLTMSAVSHLISGNIDVAALRAGVGMIDPANELIDPERIDFAATVNEAERAADCRTDEPRTPTIDIEALDLDEEEFSA